MNTRTIDLVIFDLDGTLVDSVPDLAWSANRTLEKLGLPLVEEAKARDYVGNGLETFIKRFLTQKMDGEPEPALYAKALKIFDKHYANNVAQFSQLYDGTLACLKMLRSKGFKMALATNKAQRYTHILLTHLQIEEYFEVVVGGDTVAQKKPDPMPLLHTARICDVAVQRCIMVGDSRHDIAAAKAAGMKVVAVPYGYNHGEDIANFKPDHIIDSLEKLPALLEHI